MRRKAHSRQMRGAWTAVLGVLAAWCAPAWAAHAAGPARSALLPPLRLDALAQESTAAPATAGPRTGIDWATHRRYVVPVLLSAIVPGAGEVATGHFWRGLPLVAGDVATWLGYAHYKAEGRNWRAQYEQFADAHWDYARWQGNLADNYDADQPDPNLRWYDANDADRCTCAFITKEDDRQHYYENIGKYRFFWMGWDDWSYSTADPKNSDSAANRRHYADLRIESNNNLDHATNLILVGMGARLVSVVQTVFLVRSDLRAERLAFEPRMLPGRGTGFAVTYRY